MRRTLASIVLVLTPIMCTLAACSSTSDPSFEPTESPSLRPTPPLTQTASLSPALTPTASPSLALTPTDSPVPTPAPSINWGPMAVALRPPYLHEARLEGVLRITSVCVYLEHTPGQILLIWPNDRSAWRADVGGVEFTNPDGEVVVMDGDRIILSGSDPASVDPDGWVERIDWIAPPDPSCPLDSYWELNLVIKR